jgi:UDP-N-acetylmuramoyl-L-alanyl-D-glutamate--2,6-diaminopimelate ligase
MRVSQLFGPCHARIAPSLRTQEISLSQVITDSRKVSPDSLYFAIRGTKVDGHSFVDDLLRTGVLACVVERDFEGEDPRLIRVDDPREAYGWAMSRLNGDPSQSLKVVGVTGTSGKTTTTYLIEKILQTAGHRVGVIGTVNFRIGEKILPSTHTTPGSAELQALLSEMKAEGCTAIVMEVSSHALKQHRTAGISFDSVVFTNLSPEHLDFHPDMDDYFQSKRKLFTLYPEQAKLAHKDCRCVINADDAYGKKLLLDHDPSELWSYGLDESNVRLSGKRLKLDGQGISGEVLWSEGPAIEIKTHLIARFNAYNLLAAVGAGLSLGVRPAEITQALSSFSQVPGRLERVENELGLTLLVDYAHKPDALEKVLRTLQEVRQGSQRIVTVVGCGGDRDRTKRPVMGRLSAELSDLAVITSDNPRTEDPERIIREVIAGVPEGLSERVRVESDRKKAIGLAVSLASPGDIILIAGKGHEDYQILADPQAPGGTRKIHFDDREVAQEASRERAQKNAKGIPQA